MKKTTILFLLFISIISNSVFAQIPTNGLVAWYPLDGNANDSSGNGHNGIISGAISTTNRFGIINKAFSFNGIDNYINTNLNTGFTSQISIAFWVKSAITNNMSGLITSRGSNSFNGISFLNGGNICYYAVSGGYWIYTTNTNLIDNNWHFIVGTYSGNEQKLYIDGILYSTSASYGSVNVGNYFKIGKDDEANDRYLNGQIDDLRFYNRVLSSVEIKKIYQEGIPIPSISNQIGCIGGMIPSLTAIGSNIKWYGDSSLTNLIYQGNTFPTGVSSAGVYKYYVTQTISGIEGPATIDTLTIYTLPSKPAIPNGNTCISSSITSYTTSANNAVSYNWNILPLNAGNISGTNTIGTVNWNSSYSGLAKIFVSANNIVPCNGVVSDTLFVTVNAIPSIPTTPTGALTLCQNTTSTIFTTTNTTNASSYLWSISPITAGAISSTSISGTVLWNNSFYGNAFIKVKAINGSCESNFSDSISINVLQSPTSTITPNGVTTFCQDGSVILNANTGTNLFYQWKKDTTIIGTNSSYTANQTGSYTVIVTNINNCSTTSLAVNVTVNPLPPSLITALGSTTICQGTSATLNANTGAGLTYVWKLNGSAITNAIGASYLATQQGDYTVYETNSYNCSATSSLIHINVNPSPTATITAHGNTSFCQGNSVLLTSNNGTGLTYQWQKNGIDINGATDTMLIVSQTGNYSVTIKNTYNCTATDNKSITVNPIPTAIAGANKTVCNGDTLSLHATGGASYSWNNGVVQGVPFTPSATTTYVVTVTANGCSAKDSLVVTVNPVPPVPTITQNGSSLMSSSATNNQWFSNGNIIPGAISQIYNATVAGFYQVQVTNSYACKSISAIINVSLGIEDNENNKTINVYPNPVSNELIIEIKGNKEKLNFEILNAIGQVVFKGKLIEKTIIETTNFSPGIYVIKLENGKFYEFKKIVKE